MQIIEGKMSAKMNRHGGETTTAMPVLASTLFSREDKTLVLVDT